MDRAKVLRLALENVSATYENEAMTVVEIGCCFNEMEGVSTYLIGDFLSRRKLRGKVFSIDIEAEHIETCKSIIKKRNPSVLDVVEFRQGHSLHCLQEIIAEQRSVHFFYLDGGAHPEVCLWEFETAQTHLLPEGIIIVDDAQFIDSKPWFHQFPLPFGKATLIYPFLLLSNYLKQLDKMRILKEKTLRPSSSFIEEISKINVPDVNVSNYAIIGNIYRHAMLLYGSPRCISYISEAVRERTEL